MQRWRKEKSAAWLIAALDIADPKDESTAELLKAATQVPAASPAYTSVRYYALRLMAQGEQERPHGRNSMRGLAVRTMNWHMGRAASSRMSGSRLSTNLRGVSSRSHAAETPAQVGVDMGDGLPDVDEEQELTERGKQEKGKEFFNDYSAEILAQRIPVQLLVESAKLQTLPAPLRRELARSTWTRATLLGNMAAADQLQPMLSRNSTSRCGRRWSRSGRQRQMERSALQRCL